MKTNYIFLVFLSFLLSLQVGIAKNKKTKQEVKMLVDTVSVKTMKDTTIVKKDIKKELFKTIKEVTEKCKKQVGLFTIYQDSTTGKAYLEISEDKFGKEFIYFAHIMDGVIDAGFARGGYLDNSIFKIEKYFDRIDFKLQNTNFYFDKENELSKAEDANINQPLFLSEKIIGSSVDEKTKKKIYLIEADNLFLTENITQLKPSKNATPDAFTLGTLSSKKSKYIWIKNFPKNTDVAVEYIYDNPSPTNYGNDEVTDARYVSVKMQHSFIEVPQNNFKPRFDDPRVGYFIEKITDQTSTSATPWRDIIHRWNLEKQDSSVAYSKPKKPIVWWIENTTPKEFRPIIKEAVLSWNQAFANAGFRDAIECYEQPDTATWEAEDIRYNVLRWTSSPHPPYGGYGPSFVNPRTGEILGADIMLEFVYLTNRLNVEKLYDVAALDNNTETPNLNYTTCAAGEIMHDNILYGNQMLDAYGFSDIDKDEFLKQALYDLVLHEVGHTFGLNHNFIASQLNTREQMQDAAYCQNTGLTASVMDYTIPNISLDKTKQGLFFDNKPGLYDKWAIRYGYLQAANEEDETTELEDLLLQSSKPENRFMNDADDMRYNGKGIDPRANIYDMSSDAIAYATDNIKMVIATLPKLVEKYATPGSTFHELRNAYLILSGNYARGLNVISRYVGGVYVNRSVSGQDPLVKPFTPVSLADQKRAMQTLSKYAFSKNAFKVNENLYSYLQMQRRGYDFKKENEDPKIHDRILNIQKGILDHLLNATVLQRIVDSKLYGNKYSINSMLNDLSNAIFIEDLAQPVSTIRQNLQQEYVTRLLSIFDEKSSYPSFAKASAFNEIQRISTWMKDNGGGDISTQSHRNYLVFLIDKALDKNNNKQ